MSVDTLWVAVAEDGGEARGGPFDSRAECMGRFMVDQFGALPYEVRKTAWEAAKAVVAQHYTSEDTA